MPAQEPVNPPSIEPSSTHTWLSLEGRHLEIEAGRPLLHRFCTICRRNFVCDVSSGKWQAVLPRIFDFEHLDQVSEQWLKEACPRQHLTFRKEASVLGSIRVAAREKRVCAKPLLHRGRREGLGRLLR
jgi:hypothetical protein